MAFEFRLPDLGEGVVEGEVVKWHVKVGDNVREDQPMVEVMTDKATVEIPSPKAGVIAEIRAPEGKICAVGVVMVVINVAGEKAAPAAAGSTMVTPPQPGKAAATKTNNGNGNGNGNGGTLGLGGHASPPAKYNDAPISAHASTSSYAAVGGKVLATPATRKLAREMGVDLKSVRPTGDNGRVTKDDVANHGGGSHGGSSQSTHGAQYAPMSTPAAAGDERIPFRGVRKKIAENMHRSRQTAAHFTYVEECDATDLSNVRKRAKARAEERGAKLSFLPFIIKAVVSGLKKFPIVNATLDEQKGEIVLRKRYHIGVAAATADGLIVMVLKDADQKSVFQIAVELEQLSEKARNNKLSREELTGSTFTISSLGALGGVLATPIINFPEVAILGVHKMKPTPVVRDGAIVIRDMMNFSISLDHRIVDGFEGAQFLQHVIALLEDPTTMFMEMV